MKCEEVQVLLVAYSHGETTPSEQTLIHDHLSGCCSCREELSLLMAMQGQVGAALQRRAAHVAPAEDAWERFEARLAKEAQPSPERFITRLAHLAPGASRILRQIFGGVTMQKRLVLAAVIGLAAVAALILNNVTPVSAQVILDKAGAARASERVPAQGIYHMRTQMYSNYHALPDGQGSDILLESYFDPQTGRQRAVTTDRKTGKVLEVYGQDGHFTYSLDFSEGAQYVGEDGLLLVYRTPQERARLAGQKERLAGETPEAAELFNRLRSDPQVQFVGQETWENGQTVYVLRSQQPVKAAVDDGAQPPMGEVVGYFDTQSYVMVGNRAWVQKDGQKILIHSRQVLLMEILPEGSPVAWDLSDVQGITLVDDPQRVHGDLLPEILSAQELAAKTGSAYLLEVIPAGYELEISAPPRQDEGAHPFLYIASYRHGNDYFVIQASDPYPPQGMLEGYQDETYTTAGGLVLRFAADVRTSSAEKTFTSALVEAPGGVNFMINTSLPRQTCKEWVEGLILVK